MYLMFIIIVIIVIIIFIVIIVIIFIIIIIIITRGELAKMTADVTADAHFNAGKRNTIVVASSRVCRSRYKNKSTQSSLRDYIILYYCIL